MHRKRVCPSAFGRGANPFLYEEVKGLECLERFVEIFDDVVDVFCTDGETDGGRRNTAFCQFLLVHLGMRRRCRMDDEGLDICDVGEEAEDLQMIDEFLCLFCTALDFECKDRNAAVREVLLVKLMIRMVRQGWMVNLCDMRVFGKVVNNLERIFNMAFNTE